MNIYINRFDCLVNCRIGSLEREYEKIKKYLMVNCRIGSLESVHLPQLPPYNVNCRIGSLETQKVVLVAENLC